MLPFPAAVLVLAALLFIPVSKLIWVVSVRRLERKAETELSERERKGQLTRARVIAAIVCLVFSYLFNLQLTGLNPDG